MLAPIASVFATTDPIASPAFAAADPPKPQGGSPFVKGPFVGPAFGGPPWAAGEGQCAADAKLTSGLLQPKVFSPCATIG